MKRLILGFFHHSQSWYKSSVPAPSISFGYYDPEHLDHGHGECTLIWDPVHEGGLTPQIQMWQRSWHMFTELSAVFESLSTYNKKDFLEEDAVRLLEELGFEDLTEYQKRG